MRLLSSAWLAAFAAGPGAGTVLAGGANPWADEVVSYSAGVGFAQGFTNAQVALGSPERVTGEIFGFPGAVTPFNTPFGNDEIVSIGAGGQLTVRFDEPITDAPTNAFGVDLIVFGNGFFIGPPVSGLSAEGPFTVSVSQDGVNFSPIAGSFNDGLFPTLGYTDLTGPFDPLPGAVPTDFTKPMDPSLTVADFIGLSFDDVVALYDGSGGGVPIDISSSGLTQVNFVRIDVPGAVGKVEIDGFSTVPEPATAFSLLFLFVAPAFRRN